MFIIHQLTVNDYTICRLFSLCSGVKVIINTTSCHSSLCINLCNCCAHNLQSVSIAYQSTIPSFNKHHPYHRHYSSDHTFLSSNKTMNTSPTHNNTVTLLSDYDTGLKNLFLNSAKTLCMEPSVIDYLLMELLRRIAEQSNLHGNPRFVTTSMFIKSLAIKRKGPPTAGEEALLALYPILDKMMDKEKEKAREQWLVDHQLAPAPEEKKDKKKKDKKKKKKKKSKKNNLKTTGLTAEQMKRIEEQKAAAQRKKKVSYYDCIIPLCT